MHQYHMYHKELSSDSFLTEIHSPDFPGILAFAIQHVDNGILTMTNGYEKFAEELLFIFKGKYPKIKWNLKS